MTRDNACNGSGAGDSAVLTSDDAAIGRGRRWRLRAGLAAGASLLAVVGIGFAAGAAEASTFPGTNGVIAYSAQIATEPTNTGSKYEIVSKTSGPIPASGVVTEYRCTVNQLTDVQPKFSQDGKIVAWLQNGNVVTMKLSVSTAASTTWDCPYNLDGSLRAGATVYATNQVTSDALDSWLGGWSRWEDVANTPTDPSDDKAWLFFSRRTPQDNTTTPATPANFEVFKAQVDKDGVLVAGTLENVTNNAAATDSQPDVCTDDAGTRKLVWTSNRVGSLRPVGSTTVPKTDIWEEDLTASDYDLADSSPANRGENTVNEEGTASYKPNDCTRIVFQTDRDSVTGVEGPPRNLEIYRTDATSPTTTVKRLTYNDPTLATNATLIDVTGYDVTPQWSPDALRVCFHSGRADTPPQWQLTAGLSVLGQWEVYTVDAVNGEGPGWSAAQRETRRELNDERCGWQKAS